MKWQPIATAPKDNARSLYLARFDKDGDMLELDFDGGWEYWQESWELAHINGYMWVSANGIEEPTHWAYQDEGAPPGLPDNAIYRDKTCSITSQDQPSKQPLPHARRA